MYNIIKDIAEIFNKNYFKSKKKKKKKKNNKKKLFKKKKKKKKKNSIIIKIFNYINKSLRNCK